MFYFPTRTPVFEPAFHRLASPVSVLHDHPYSHHGNKALKKQLPPARLLNNTPKTHFPLSTEDIVCKRNCFSRSYEKIPAVVVETDFAGHSTTLHNKLRLGRLGGGRAAKHNAKQKISDGFEDEISVNKQLKRIKKSKKKRKPKPNPLAQRSPTDSSTYSPVSSPLAKINISSSLISRAQNCSVGLTPTVIRGVSSPLRVTHYNESLVETPTNSTSLSSHCSSLSPTTRPCVRPCSVSLKRLPVFHQSILIE